GSGLPVEQQQSKVQMRGAKFRVEGDCSAVREDRFLPALQFRIRIAQLKLRRGILGALREVALEWRNGGRIILPLHGGGGILKQRRDWISALVRGRLRGFGRRSLRWGRLRGLLRALSGSEGAGSESDAYNQVSRSFSPMLHRDGIGRGFGWESPREFPCDSLFTAPENENVTAPRASIGALSSAEFLPQRVSLLYRLSGNDVPAILVTSAIAAFALWGYISDKLLAAWLIWLVLASLVRIALQR